MVEVFKRIEGAFRIRIADLEGAVERLNAVSKRTYVLHGAYGRWGLDVVVDPKTGARSHVIPLTSKRDCYDAIWSIIRYVGFERE